MIRSIIRVGRNDLCPCGSRKKYKQCCMRQQQRGATLARRTSLAPARTAPKTLTANPGQLTTIPNSALAPVEHSGLEPNVLPVEIGLHYTFPEPLGVAEVTHILPAGRIYKLADGREIVNDDLQPGMLVRLKDGNIGTITSVEQYFEPPRPPVQIRPGFSISRVIGTIKHKGLTTTDVSWVDNTVTASSDHKFYSFSRGQFVPAEGLRVGEFLDGDDGTPVPVTGVGATKLGLVDLYNLEVEHYHNYFVGSGPSVLVHNGATGGGGYINTPDDFGPARSDLFPDSTQVKYGEGLSALPKQRRTAGGARDGVNLAVFEFVEGGVVKTKLFKSVPEYQLHSEQVGAIWLSRRGIDPKSVTRIYSEFHPCVEMCKPLVRTEFPNAAVQYSWPYKTSNQFDWVTNIGRAAKRDALRGL